MILTITFGRTKILAHVLTAVWPTLKSLHWTVCFSGPRHMLPGADDLTKLRISLVELLAHMCPVAQNTHISSTPRNFLQPGKLALSGMEKKLLVMFAFYIIEDALFRMYTVNWQY